MAEKIRQLPDGLDAPCGLGGESAYRHVALTASTTCTYIPKIYR